MAQTLNTPMDNTNTYTQPCGTLSPSSSNEAIYIKECRAQLNRRLNELESSTRVLPPEMLSEIFTHLCSDNNSDGIYHLFQISSVCSHWYQTARSTPHLWATLQLTIDVGNPRSNANILQLWLTNIRGPTLTLELVTFWSALMGPEVEVEGVMDPFVRIFAMKQNSEKIRELKLSAPHPSWMPSITKNCVNLEKLEITQLPIGGINLENQLHLRTLILLNQAHVAVQPVKLSPSLNITTLEINYVTDSSTCLGLVSECQHSLTNLSITAFFYSSEGYNGSLPITLGHLRTLHLRISSTLESFISHMKFPALENLTLDLDLAEYEDEVFTPLEGFSLLCKSLPRVPTTLEIVQGGELEWELSHLLFQSLGCHLLNADQIQELVIIVWEEEITAEILKLLLDVKMFPSLRRLVLDVGDFSSLVIWCIPLFEMLEIRKFGLKRPFQLEVRILECELEAWKEEIVDFVERLGEKGYSISLSFDVKED